MVVGGAGALAAATVGALAAVAWAGPAAAAVPSPAAASAPLDTQAVRVELLARHPGSVRVTGDFGTRIVEKPWVDADGLHYRVTPPLRPAIIVRAEAAGRVPPPLPNPIPWSSLQRIERAQFRIGRGPFLGAVIGTAVGYIVHRRLARTANGDDWSGLFVPFGFLAGGAVGIVATAGDRWVDVPAPPHAAGGRSRALPGSRVVSDR